MRKVIVFVIVMLFNLVFLFGINNVNTFIEENDYMIYFKGKPLDENPLELEEEEENDNFKGESIEQVAEKMDKYFEKTDLAGYGSSIASISIKRSVNPYLIAGIILESTSCKFNCSPIFRECHNVYGIKGIPGCFGGSYKDFDNFEDSVTELVKLIKTSFPDEEKRVPNEMFKEYGKNAIWAFKVNKYMDEIKGIKIKK